MNVWSKMASVDIHLKGSFLFRLPWWTFFSYTCLLSPKSDTFAIFFSPISTFLVAKSRWTYPSLARYSLHRGKKQFYGRDLNVLQSQIKWNNRLKEPWVYRHTVLRSLSETTNQKKVFNHLQMSGQWTSTFGLETHLSLELRSPEPSQLC